MTKIIAALVCVAFTGVASAEDSKPPKQSHRQAKILRSLDKMEKQLEKARGQFDRLEGEIKTIRAELAEIRATEPPAATATPESVPVPITSVVISQPSTVEENNGKKTQVYTIRDANFAPLAAEGAQPLVQSPYDSEYLLIIPPEGNRVVAFDNTTRRSLPLRLSDDPTVRHRVQPVQKPSVVGLAIEGSKITRLAVFAIQQSGTAPSWHTIELREPVDRAIPEVEGYGPVLYLLGHRVYAYSPRAERWDVLELPRGVVPERGNPSSKGPTFEHAGHIYTFGIESGQWTDLDTRAILEGAGDPKPN